ncbi:deoxyribonuclease IV [Marinitenerispora sediminis]|uniref:Probable endonuclease 4 n=1 Tax=Marinitenerispora sediminis TaxID=1931232 RepID=A0A368TBH4_9ACTN|nr:deoxyribonuclease IV [Marinitenerispora sediminis]RCV50423.1 endonuclease IV [Marinitenerispora sediminis]RCV55311.1 endonuclease IV [Marinitenerispora sediminis]RCV62493.1 endonuclease IV [Marinitenerispora sediminis]
MSALPLSPVGAHVPVSGGLATRGLAYADEVGAEAVQVFVSNPRGWAVTPGHPAEDARLRARADLPVYVHAPYLVNLGSPDAEVAEKSVAAVEHALLRGAGIGARGVVVHTGSAVRGERAAGLARMRERLLPVLDGLPEDAPPVLLEPMAGQGQVLCAAVEHLGPYLAALGHHPKAGVCLDTAHAFGAGHDIATPEGMRAMLDEFAAVVGPGRLGLVHANDSKAPCGSNRDRHENIGAGLIGARPFAELFRHPVSAGVPIVVETPGPAGPHAADIATLKALRTGVTAGSAGAADPVGGAPQ